MMVQLYLQFNQVQGFPCPDTCEELDAAAIRQGFYSLLKDPCKGCPLDGLCSDDCGMIIDDEDLEEL